MIGFRELSVGEESNTVEQSSISAIVFLFMFGMVCGSTIMGSQLGVVESCYKPFDLLGLHRFWVLYLIVFTYLHDADWIRTYCRIYCRNGQTIL